MTLYKAAFWELNNFGLVIFFTGYPVVMLCVFPRFLCAVIVSKKAVSSSMIQQKYINDNLLQFNKIHY